MNLNKRVVNADDRRRLTSAIGAARSSWRTYGPYLDWLTAQLNDADVRQPSQIPDDVVTMNSRIQVQDLRTGQTETLRLAYPDEPDTQRSVSIFEPRGLALLGTRVGDLLCWSEEDRLRTARVCRLDYQPESAGKSSSLDEHDRDLALLAPAPNDRASNA